MSWITLSPVVAGAERWRLLAVDAPSGLYTVEIEGASCDYQGARVIPARGAASEAAAEGDLLAWLAAPSPIPPTFAQARAAALDQAKQAREAQIGAGFAFRGKWIQTRGETDRANIVEAFLAVQMDPQFATTWRTADNSPLELDAVGIGDLAAAWAAHKNGAWAAFWQREAAINAAVTRAELEALA